jgi:5-methylcytosine-specific restriction endonuclease McrA
MPVVEGWTEGRLKSFITSTIRGGFRRWPNKFLVLKEALRGKKINKNSGRMAAHYECASCHELFPNNEVQVDHIEPIVDPKVGFVSWDLFIENLFCSTSNLQVLCKWCHSKKTKEERGRKK